MPIIAKVPGGDFKPAPEGLFRAVCVDVVDLGMVRTEWKGVTRTSHKVRLCWQIEDRDEETKKPFLVTKRHTLSLHEKAGLRKDLESWRGRKFTEAELGGFDVEVVLGANCQLQVIRETKDGKTWANVAAVVPAAKGLPKLEPEGYVRVKDRDREPAEGEWQATDEDVPF